MSSTSTSPDDDREFQKRLIKHLDRTYAWYDQEEHGLSRELFDPLNPEFPVTSYDWDAYRHGWRHGDPEGPIGCMSALDVVIETAEFYMEEYGPSKDVLDAIAQLRGNNGRH